MAEQPPAGSVIPKITCPVCGKHLRLSSIMPEEEHRERMIFACECGFDYRQSYWTGQPRVR